MKNRIAQKENCLFLIAISFLTSGLCLGEYDIGACFCIAGVLSFLISLYIKAKKYRKRKDAEYLIADTKKAESL
jgi:hypothetical protein